jgi:hypothetical protein
MKISPPEVVAPLSVCSKLVQIRGNISGATVQTSVNGVEAASHVSINLDNVYEIGASLKANDVVTARQELDGDVSDPSLAVTAQEAPEQLSPLTVHTYLTSVGVRFTRAGRYQEPQ